MHLRPVVSMSQVSQLSLVSIKGYLQAYENVHICQACTLLTGIVCANMSACGFWDNFKDPVTPSTCLDRGAIICPQVSLDGAYSGSTWKQYNPSRFPDCVY